MATNNRRIEYTIGFKVDTSGMKQLQSSLDQIATAASGKNMLGDATDIEKTKVAVENLSKALKDSYNGNLGTLDFTKFTKSLRDSKTDINEVFDGLSAGGITGRQAIAKLSSELLGMETPLKKTNKQVERLYTSLGNVFRYNFSANLFNTFSSSISNAWSYAQNLNESLINIGVVTNDSAENMAKFAQNANKAAKALGSTTLSYTDTALTYYQQGLSDTEVAARTEATIKAANVTNQSASAVSEELTAVWNGFKTSTEDAESVVDKMAAVADTSASNLSELATAMSKVASTANAMGVSVDQLSAQIATIIATTRQAPETVGNSLKTIYARINDIQAGTEESGVTLGNYSGKMADLGVNVLDANGNLRDTGEVIEEIGSKWSTYSKEQQVYLAQTMAGQRQYNNLIALFDNWDKYLEEVNISMESNGTLNRKNSIYMEGLAAHLNELKTAWQSFYDTIFDTEEITPLIDILTNLVSVLDRLTGSFGGGVKSMIGFAAVAANIFNKQLGGTVNDIVTNYQNAKNIKIARAEKQNLNNKTREYLEDYAEGDYKTYLNYTDENGNVRPQYSKAAEINAVSFQYGASAKKDIFEDVLDETKNNDYTSAMNDASANIKKYGYELEVFSNLANQVDEATKDLYDTMKISTDQVQNFSDVLNAEDTNSNAISDISSIDEINFKEVSAEVAARTNEFFNEVVIDVAQDEIKKLKEQIKSQKEQIKEEVKNSRVSTLLKNNGDVSESELKELKKQLIQAVDDETEENIKNAKEQSKIILANRQRAVNENYKQLIEKSTPFSTDMLSYGSSFYSQNLNNKFKSFYIKPSSGSSKDIDDASLRNKLIGIGKTQNYDERINKIQQLFKSTTNSSIFSKDNEDFIKTLYTTMFNSNNSKTFRTYQSAISLLSDAEKYTSQDSLGYKNLLFKNQNESEQALKDTKTSLDAIVNKLFDSADFEDGLVKAFGDLKDNFNNDTLLNSIFTDGEIPEYAKTFTDNLKQAIYESLLSYAAEGNDIASNKSGQAFKEYIDKVISYQIAGTKHDIKAAQTKNTDNINGIEENRKFMLKHVQDQEGQKLQDNINNLEQNATSAKQDIEEYESTDIKNLRERLAKYQEDSAKTISELRENLQTTQAKLNEIETKYNELLDLKGGVQKQTGALLGAGEKAGENVRDTNGSADEYLRQADITKKTQAVTASLSALSSAYSLASSTGSIFSEMITDQNVSLSNLFQVVTSFAFMLPNIIKSVQDLSKATEIGIGTISGTLVALGAVVAIASFVNGLLEDAKENRIEDAQAAEEDAQEILDEAEANKELYKSYQSLNEEYKKTSEGRADVIESLQKAIAAYSSEDAAVATLINDYSTLTKTLNDLKKASDEETLSAVSKKLTNQDTELYENNIGLLNNVNLKVNRKDSLGSTLEQNGFKVIDNKGVYGIDNGEDYRTFLSILSDYLDQFSSYEIENSNTISTIYDEWISKYKDDYEALQDTEKEYAEAATEAAISSAIASGNSPTDFTSTEQLQSLINDVTAQVKATLGENSSIDDDDITEIISSALSDIGNDALTKLSAENTLKEEFKETIADNAENLVGYANDKLTELENEGKLSLLAYIDVEYLVDEESVDDAIDYAEKKVANENNEKGLRVLTYAASALSGDTSSSLTGSSLDKNSDISDLTGSGSTSGLMSDTEYETLKEYLEKFKGLYDENKTAAEEWTEVVKNGTGEQIRYLADLTIANQKTASESIQAQKEEAEAGYKVAVNQYQAINDKIIEKYNDVKTARSRYEELADRDDLTASEEEERDELKQLIDDYKSAISAAQEYKNTVKDLSGENGWQVFEDSFEDSVLDNFIQKIDALISKTDALKSAAELIGDGFKVSADSVSQLANVYPELLKNAQVLADGSVQLDQEVVQAITDGNSQIIAADTEATKAQLQNKIELLTAEINYSDQKISILEDALNGTISKAETEQKLEANVEQYKTDLANAAAQDQVELDDYVTKINGENTEVDLDNLAKIDEAISEISYHYSKMYDGPVDSTVGNLKATFSSSSELKHVNNVGEVDSAFTDSELESLREELTSEKANNESLNTLLGEYYSQLSSLSSSSSDAIESLSGAGSGIGGDNEAQDIEKYLDYLEDERDLYHDINIEIEDIETSISRLEKLQEKTFGKGLAASLKEEVAQLEQEKDLYQQKLQLEKEDLATQGGKLSYLGVTFDSNGNITNYLDILEQKRQEINEMTSTYNNLVDQYNASADEDTRESLQNQMSIQSSAIDAKKTMMEDLEDRISNYDELKNTIDETVDELQDLTDQEIELNIKAFNAEIDVDLDMHDAERTWNDFVKNVIKQTVDSDYTGQINAIVDSLGTYYTDLGQGEIQQLAEHVDQIRQEADKIVQNTYSDVYGDDLNAALEDLKKYNEDLMSAIENADELIDTVHQAMMDAISEADDAFADQQEKYEALTNLIDHNIKLIKLISSDDNYEDLAKYYDKLNDTYNNELEFIRNEKDLWYDRMITEQETLNSLDENTEAWERSKEKYDEYYQNWSDSVSDLNSLMETAVQNALDKWSAAVDDLLSKIKDQIYGGDADAASSQWSKTEWDDDNYLDRIDRAEALLDLQQSYNDLINDTSSVATQQKLAKLRDQSINSLADEVNLSQEEVDYEKAKLDVIEKEIALQDAQESKTKMRLRRDSQGNYTYQYVQDQDQVSEATSALQESLQNLKDVAKDAYKDIVNDINDLYDEMSEKAKTLAEEYQNDEEALKEHLTALSDEYLGEDGYITKKVAEGNFMQDAYNEATFIALEGYEKTAADDFEKFLGLEGEDSESILGATKALLDAGGEVPTLLDAFVNETAKSALESLDEETKERLLTGDDSMESIWNTTISDISNSYDSFVQTVENGMNNIISLNNDYQQTLYDIQNAAGVSFDSISNGEDVVINQTENLITDNDTLIDKYGTLLSQVQDLNEMYQDLYDKYENSKLYAIDAATAAENFWQEVIGSDYQSAFNNSLGSVAGQYEAIAVSYASALQAMQQATKDYNNGSSISITGNSSGSKSGISVDAVTGADGGGTAGGHMNMMMYDTGGYTGDWGSSSGRLAILHRKEYVLNEDDTPNILTAVNVARNITSNLATLASKGISSFADIFNNGSNIFGGNSSEGDTYNIEVTFTEPTSKETIKQALAELPNYASQRVNKNRRVK